VSLQGADAFRSRLKAVRLTFKVYGKDWADDTAAEARRRVPKATGRLEKSIRRKSATQKRATVVGHYSANFVDAGSKAHDILPKNAPALVFQGRSGRTIFARKVHKQRIGPRPFKRASAEAALRRHPMSETLTKLWNDAA
jgi:hypothetical protein